MLLEHVLKAASLPLRYFPSTMVLACCGRAGRCFNSGCTKIERVPLRRGARDVQGKYYEEIKFSVRHAAAFGCPGARYVPVQLRTGESSRHLDPGVDRSRDGHVSTVMCGEHAATAM